ncbi:MULTISPECIES: Rpn family recombination-promoting nuclease/putative transposase [spotted fever group]|uniref:PD-(D/E)XK nuclease transposase family protein n=1 Tax=Rickettsia rhipicephali str. Ect TaxID=1359199 RepID=A0A0F3PJG1_RICRH|nr:MULTISPECIES: Rpn family recombination-promoting nuclease/putative transposase [spotted fever group]KJV79339.1 PD-(D/E)XK nuclease transposase family protein [Rickettsia rhipicephali str. Ect]
MFDLKVKDETGRWYIIEMQRKMEKDYLNRTQLYGCYTYVSQIKKGMKHKDLLPVVIISIIRAKALPDELPYISYHHIKESNTHKQYLFSLTYVFIELGKFKKK